jgi:hypothetical protein
MYAPFQMLLQSRHDRTRIGMRCLRLVGIVREQPRNSQQLHRGKMQAIKPPTVRLSSDPLLTQGYPVRTPITVLSKGRHGLKR